MLTSKDQPVATQEIPIVAELSIRGTGGQGQVLAVQTATFSYEREIPLWLYVVLGFLGIAVGYSVRLVVKALSAVPAPSPAPPKPEDPQPGPLTTFIKSNYYYVDFGVTLVLGTVALLVLTHSGRPPAKAADWPGAVALGVSLGVLANSELFTRLGR